MLCRRFRLHQNTSKIRRNVWLSPQTRTKSKSAVKWLQRSVHMKMHMVPSCSKAASATPGRTKLSRQLPARSCLQENCGSLRMVNAQPKFLTHTLLPPGCKLSLKHTHRFRSYSLWDPLLHRGLWWPSLGCAEETHSSRRFNDSDQT